MINFGGKIECWQVASKLEWDLVFFLHFSTFFEKTLQFFHFIFSSFSRFFHFLEILFFSSWDFRMAFSEFLSR